MTVPVHYATYFDSYFLTRGLALYRSLERHSPPFVLWVLALDEACEAALRRLALPMVRVVSLAALEAAEPGLLSVKPERLPLEYYWTCGPAFLLHVVREHPGVDAISYVDADLYFFGSPAPLWEELGAGSILIVEHRTAREVDDPRGFAGTFNVGLLTFRRTANGIRCLTQWRDDCLEWCFDRQEPGRYGDQGYLEKWPSEFPDLRITGNPGATVAPWNIDGVRFVRDGRAVRANGYPVICYHFSKVRRVSRHAYELHDWRFHRRILDRGARRLIYAPYVAEVFRAERHLRQVGVMRVERAAAHSTAEQLVRRRLARKSSLPLWHRARRFMLVGEGWTL